jgi:hypothetical protein
MYAFPSLIGSVESESKHLNQLILSIILMFSFFTASMLTYGYERRSQKNKYIAWLTAQKLSFLIKIQSSEELDNTSRDIVTEYLNVYHEGWSLN